MFFRTMQVKTTLLMVLVFSFMSSSGQKFNAGILGGISTSQVDGDHLSGFHKAGLKAGGFVSRKIGERMQLQFEMEFIQKGSRLPLSKDGVFYLMRLNYIEVPLLVNYRLGKKWTIEAGGAFATLVSTYEEDQLGEITNAPPFHSADYLVCVGGNYFITDHLIFNARYSYSVTTIRPKNENYNYFYFIGGQYNKVLAFSLEWKF
ncbi:MAG: porin family protein [Bacteroidota bacterium]